MTQPTLHAVIKGTGSALPRTRVSNAELAAKVDTTDEWITERTGIHSRHFADEGVFSSDLGVEAAKKALEAAGKNPQDIDLINFLRLGAAQRPGQGLFADFGRQLGNAVDAAAGRTDLQDSLFWTGPGRPGYPGIFPHWPPRANG